MLLSARSARCGPASDLRYLGHAFPERRMKPERNPTYARRWRLMDRLGWWMFGVTLGVCLVGSFAWMATGAWIGAGFFAKQLCSGVFVSGRAPHQVVDSDLRRYMPAIVHRYMRWTIDEQSGTVSARWLKSIGREASFKTNQGCKLVYERGGASLRVAPEMQHGGGVRPQSDNARVAQTRIAPFVPRGQEAQALKTVVDEAFAASTGATTRAVIVIHRGAIVAERYAAGFDAHTRLPGWSLSKSVMNAMIGALVQQDRLDVYGTVPIAAWRQARDGRSQVTYDHLLRMASGLRFDEDYDNPFSDVTRMLFGVADASAYAESRPLVAAPGSVWSYSSGSTMVLAHALAAHADTPASYRDLPRRLLFRPIGMRSAVMETDASGTFEATASMYATALDWARFGWLYVNDGLWNGVRILPRGWVDYSSRPTSADPSRRYGAHFWIYNDVDRIHVQRLGSGELPHDAFYAEGFGGQRITISPSTQTVIVRLGVDAAARGFDNTRFAARILRALEVNRSMQQRADRLREKYQG